MQAPNAQGIMGLMAQGRAPQQPPMPSPNSGGPMAGIGSVEERVAAYRGNPAPLQQRYAVSQDLLDLLALQKIKSEKEAAARQMQLAMGQQAAMQGGQPPTIMQQREKEVHDLTKNELAQQRGETAQQQQAQQQDALQKLMGGIAAAPGAQAAAQPKAMAAGGIVAFAGPTDGSLVPSLEEQDPEFDADGNPRSRSERERIMAQNARIREMKGNAQALGGMRDRRVADLESANAGVPERMAEFYKPRRPDITSANQAVATQGATPAAPPAPAPVAQAAPTPAPRPPAPAPAPAAAPTPGIAGLPQAGGAVPGMPSYGNDMNALALKQAQRDDRAEGLAEEGRISKLLAPPEEQLQAIRDANAQRKQWFEQRYNPATQREDALIRFLTSAGGRRYGELGAGAQAAQNYISAQEAARAKDFEDMQKGIMQPFDLRRGALEKGITAGQTASKTAGEGQRAGLTALYHQYTTDVGSRDKALDRAVEQLKINLQAETNRISREGLDLSKAQSAYAAATGRVQELERKLDADFAKQNGMLLMAEQSGKMDPAQKQQLEVARTQLEIKKDQIRKELEPVLASARTKLGVGAPSGYKVTEITPGKK